ncbi:MAG: outer membrane lipid asymmetry maintenance protein MlaD [Mariprofundaceae bacterium]|nr:outer membrane lipid asymmetry maintenance protein MlaD [Mariprofundaceae bacterium]
MEAYKRIEITVGLFVFIGLLSMGYLALKLGQIGGLGQSGYTVEAVFQDAGGMRVGGDVMLAGVVIGRVDAISLKDNEEARLTLRINDGVKISTDAFASIRTKGIIGDRYVRITPGMEEDYLEEGDEIEETESAINIEDLISKYIFSGKENLNGKGQ